MHISVILATYNAPAWLEKVVWGYAFQSLPPAEIVIADDGSTQETLLAIERLRKATRLNLRHVWHPDRGFRKCEILNKAILAASGDYLVFSDGDCIPRRDFLSAHAAHAKPGRFLSGGLVRLPLNVSEAIGVQDIAAGRAFAAPWLREQGLNFNHKLLLLAAPYRLSAMLDAVTTTRATWNGHNASGWKSDLLRVNGFDERMGYGGEDRELGERLVNLGIRPKQIRHRAVCVHLDHGRGYVDQEMVQWNIRHRQEIRSRRTTWTEYGIHKGGVEYLRWISPQLAVKGMEREDVAA